MECDMAPSKDKTSRLVMIIIEAIVPVLSIIILYIFVFVMVSGRCFERGAKAFTTRKERERECFYRLLLSEGIGEGLVQIGR